MNNYCLEWKSKMIIDKLKKLGVNYYIHTNQEKLKIFIKWLLIGMRVYHETTWEKKCYSINIKQFRKN